MSLTDLTKKGSPNVLVWADVHDQAFRTLKQCVSSPPVLRLPDVSKPFILQTGASSEGIGAILLQKDGQIKYPVAFASKKLLPRERIVLPLRGKLWQLFGEFRNLRST